MSRELAALLQQRSRMGRLRWPLGVGFSFLVHGAVLVILVLANRHNADAVPEVKVTWVSLPSATGPAGGATAQEKGDEGERQRRVEEVAPRQDVAHPTPTPNAWGSHSSAPARGTSSDLHSTGTAPVAAKGRQPDPHSRTGAAGEGGGHALGRGSSSPGLKATNGVQGGTGMVGDLDSSFPFLWYLQNVQNRITSNWTRQSSAQGRVQIYFRIRRDGSLDGARVEIPSGNGIFDQSALLAVKRSFPLQPLPDGFDGQTLGVRFWFTYLGD
nr:TonB family protein [uncultured Holophaga sp.]